MTIFWAALVGAATGVLLFLVASPDPRAVYIGAVGTVAMTCLVWLWRTFLKP